MGESKNAAMGRLPSDFGLCWFIADLVGCSYTGYSYQPGHKSKLQIWYWTYGCLRKWQTHLISAYERKQTMNFLRRYWMWVLGALGLLLLVGADRLYDPLAAPAQRLQF
jgi:hypothetical protein